MTFKFDLTSGSQVSSVVCDAAITEQVAPSMLLTLDDGGSSSLVFSGLEIKATVLNDCVESKLGKGCDTFDCKKVACGLCECSSALEAIEPNDSATWTRNGGQLVLDVSFDTFVFDYCVAGDRLTLRIPNSETLLELERVYLVGQPTACEERALASCVASTAPGDACHVGACVGSGASCAAAMNEGLCTNQQACSWDTTKCAGNPDPFCRIADYGHLAGCEVSSESPVCVGTPETCDGYSSDACPILGGCQVVDACTGAKTQCSGYWESCAAGCSCADPDEDGICLCGGQADCSKALSKLACEDDAFLCKWSPVCSGTLPDCGSAEPASCLTIPGCRLAAP